jgi:hypothetical protein
LKSSEIISESIQSYYMPKPVQQAKQAKTAPSSSSAAADEEVKSITCPEFQPNRLFFKSTDLKPNTSQITCFLKYQYDMTKKPTRENNEKGEKLLMVTKPIKIVRGGIPRHNPKYHGADENSTKRAYFYVPKNLDDPNSMELFDAIDRFDDYMDDEINTKKNANGILCYKGSNGNEVKCKGITYVRMVTTAQPQSFGDDEEGEKKFVPWDRIKVKLSTVYDDKLGPDDIKEINTQVYVGTNEEAEKICTVTDVEKYFRWNCTAQFALDFSKAWVMTTKDKKCSIGIKCVQIGVTEISEFKAVASKQLNKRLFGPGSGSGSNSGPKADTTKKNTKKEVKQEEEEEQEPEEQEAEEGEEEAEAEEGEDEGEGEEQADAEEQEEGEGEGEGDAEEQEGPEEQESEPEEAPEPEPPKKGKKTQKNVEEPVVKVVAKNTKTANDTPAVKKNGSKK